MVPFTDGERIIYAGLAEEVLRASKALNYADNPTQFNWVPIDPEALKRIYDDMVLSSNAEVLFFTQVCGVEKEGSGEITSVLMANKSGLTAASAKVYVDYIARRSFSDEIARNCYFIDIHTTKAEQKIDQRKAFAAHREKQIRYGKGESHGIPYRCLTPKGLKNMLMAGRCISTDRVVQGSTRVMPVCLAMGEAAGIAAAMVANGPSHDVHAVDTSRLRALLKKNGAYLPDADEAQQD